MENLAKATVLARRPVAQSRCKAGSAPMEER